MRKAGPRCGSGSVGRDETAHPDAFHKCHSRRTSEWRHAMIDFSMDPLLMMQASCYLKWNKKCYSTVTILSFQRDRSGQTVWTILQSDQGLHCLPFCRLLLDALLNAKNTLFIQQFFGCPNFQILWYVRMCPTCHSSLWHLILLMHLSNVFP